MDVFTMVVIIVAIACTAGVIEKVLKHRRNELEQQPVNDEVYEELDRLRVRIEVLEKIVTDESYQLNSEISRLERKA
ncbi:MAG: hypothetical protein O3A63_11435 [Proteobacteria bacterium]|nr:hypothetical protein [Pseudomonadota bacterium]